MANEKFTKLNFETRTQDLERIEFDEILNDVKPIIFDTNFLFVTFEFKLDVVYEIERLIGKSHTFYIYEGTISEILNIERKGAKNKKFLPLISTMLHRYNFKVIKSDQKYIDDQLVENLDDRVIIATNDKELRHKIWDSANKVIYMRQTSYLELK